MRALPWPLVSILLLGDMVAAQPTPERASDAVLGQRPCVELVDTLDDGEIDRRVRFEYGSDGRLLAAYLDIGADGTIERIDRYDVSPDGLVQTIETERSPDGRVSERLGYVYEDGLLTREALDRDADGELDSVYELEYDAEGRLVGEVWRATDSPPEHVYYAYSESGQLENEVVDVGDDGAADEIITYTYGEAGLTGIDEDLDADGVADWRVRYRYDPNARLVIEEWRSDRGDELQLRTRFSYDTRGRLIETTLDEGDDGVVDVRTTYTWDCWRP